MDSPNNIETVTGMFKDSTINEKEKFIFNLSEIFLSEILHNEKNVKNIMGKYFDIEGITICTEKIINKNTGERCNARSGIIDGEKFIFFDNAKIVTFYSALVEINNKTDLSKDEILAISYYAHEYIHHLQKKLWIIDTTGEHNKIAYVLLETSTETLARRLTIDFLSDIYKNNNVSHFKETLNQNGAYNKTTGYFNRFLDDLGKEDIFDKIGDILQTTDDPNKTPERFIDSILNIINNRIKEIGGKTHLKVKSIKNILKGEKSLSDILK